MADRYHISDDGTPGRCRARNIASCPKTKAGDTFHGTEIEAAAESERRFEAEFGSTVTLGTADHKKLWNAKSHALFLQVREYYRNAPSDHDWDDVEAHTEELRIRGLARIHGVDPSSVRNSSGSYIVEEADGTPRIYGFRSSDNPLSYLGVLHPKLDGVVRYASESKMMIGDREASYDESLYRHDAEYFGYATVELKRDGERYSFTTDANGNPVDRQVWDFIGDTTPREIFEDDSLRDALSNGGAIPES